MEGKFTEINFSDTENPVSRDSSTDNTSESETSSTRSDTSSKGSGQQSSFQRQVVVVSWDLIVEEAQLIVKNEPFMKTHINELILGHRRLSSCLTAILTAEFAGVSNANMWKELFSSAFEDSKTSTEQLTYPKLSAEALRKIATLTDLALYDLAAVRDRDPATSNLFEPMLYHKGFKAILAYRVAHLLWVQGRTNAALLIQSRCSQVLGVDIHPAAEIGPGFMLDHGTGVVIGETAKVGAHCSFLHGVTLGSTGKDKGDRHPKIGSSVLIGCGASVLGNIRVGNCCKIGAGSIVLKSLPDRATAVGNPARIIGYSTAPCAASEMDTALQKVLTHTGEKFSDTWSVSMDNSTVFDEADTTKRSKLDEKDTALALTLRFGVRPSADNVSSLFRQVDQDNDGLIDRREFEMLAAKLADAKAANVVARAATTVTSNWTSSFLDSVFGK